MAPRESPNAAGPALFRSRRFRAAKDLQEQVMAAKQSGELAGDEEAFDSNCITPGTEFMTEVRRPGLNETNKARLLTCFFFLTAASYSSDVSWAFICSTC